MRVASARVLEMVLAGAGDRLHVIMCLQGEEGRKAYNSLCAASFNYSHVLSRTSAFCNHFPCSSLVHNSKAMLEVLLGHNWYQCQPTSGMGGMTPLILEGVIGEEVDMIRETRQMAGGQNQKVGTVTTRGHLSYVLKQCIIPLFLKYRWVQQRDRKKTEEVRKGDRSLEK